MSNNKLALHFGAGNIGRGFICPELKKSNYDVVFVDVNEDLIDEINLKKEYKITSLDLNSESSEVIRDVTGISINDNESIKSYLSKADIISTSVGPRYVQGIYELIDNVNTSGEIFFIAFENQYRSSTKAQPKNSKNIENIISIDAVVDKIVPPQNNNSLDVVVEQYGSIILDDLHYKPLDESDIVTYGDYEVEFIKKLWLLNGLHLKLAYFGISKDLKFIHEIFEYDEYKSYATDALEALATAFISKTDYEYELSEFKKSILNRFSQPALKDEVVRVARNPKLKFSKNERFQAPLDVLINKGMEVNTFKAIIDLLMSTNFDAVEGYDEFNNFTEDGLDFFLSEYWELSSDNVDKYKGGLI